MSTFRKQRRFTGLHLFALHAAVTVLFVQWLPNEGHPRPLAETIERLDGTLEYDNRGVPINVYFPCCRLAPHQLGILADYQSLKVLDLWNCSAATDEGLAHLRNMENLEVLVLAETQVTDHGLRHLAELKNLRHLSLSRTSITDAGLAYLRNLPRLESIVLEDTAITDAGIAQLASCKQLKSMTLIRTGVSNECVRKLRAALPQTCIFV